MARSSDKERSSDTFRMNPVSLFALIGAVFAFFVVGAIIDVLWVALGAAIGAGIDVVVRRYGRETRRFAEAVDLSLMAEIGFFDVSSADNERGSILAGSDSR